MLSYETIRQLARDAGRKAKRSGKTPFVPESLDQIESEAFSIPSFGDYRPKGWDLVEERLCDKTGWGAPDEPALTIDQFKGWLQTALGAQQVTGFAVIEEGQFQVVVGRFEKRRPSARTLAAFERKLASATHNS